MRRHQLSIVCLIFLATVLSLVGSALAEQKVAVAIMPFREGQLSHWWGWDWNLAEGVTALVTDTAVKQDRLTIVERSRLEEILVEQDLGEDGRIDQETASKIGRVFGARILVYGTITEWSMAQTAGVGIGPFRVAGSQAKVVLTGRAVDSETGQVLGAFEGSGSKVGASFSIDSYRGISLEGEQFASSTLGQATKVAIDKFIADMTNVAEKAALSIGQQQAAKSQTGVVIAVLPGNQIVINLGSKHGLKVNSKVDIVRQQTFPGLKDPVSIPVGTAKVISADQEACVAQIESKTQDVQEGDVIKHD